MLVTQAAECGFSGAAAMLRRQALSAGNSGQPAMLAFPALLAAWPIGAGSVVATAFAGDCAEGCPVALAAVDAGLVAGLAVALAVLVGFTLVFPDGAVLPPEDGAVAAGAPVVAGVGSVRGLPPVQALRPMAAVATNTQAVAVRPGEEFLIRRVWAARSGERILLLTIRAQLGAHSDNRAQQSKRSRCSDW